MIHAHGGDDRRLRHINDVGGIQFASQPYFQHHDVAAAAQEVQHSHGGDEFKLRGVVGHSLRSGTDLLRQGSQLFRSDQLPVHLDPLPEVLQKRGRAKAHPVSGAAQDGRQAGAHASFSVGARHMDELQLLVGIPQSMEQRTDALQTRGMGLPLKAVDIRDCLPSVHRLPPPFKPGAQPPAAAAISP